MKKIVNAMLLISCILLFSFSETLQKEETGTITNVEDGDLFDFKTSTKTISARLFAIDAPEADQANSKLAKTYLTGYLNKPMKIIIRGVEKSGRTVVDLYSGDVWINFEMGKLGYVWYYKSAQKKLKDAIDQAKWEQKGIWIQKYAVPPWEWRKGVNAVMWEEKMKAGTTKSEYDHFLVAEKPAATQATKTTAAKTPAKTATKTAAKPAGTTDETVYFCKGEPAKYYHKATCKALTKCKVAVEKTTKSKAKSQGRKPCELCY